MAPANRRRRVDAPSSSRTASRGDIIDVDSNPRPSANPYLQHRPANGNNINPLSNKPFSRRYYTILETRIKLPIYESRKRLLSAIKESKIVVLEGETGSGKTTQVPQFLVEAGYADDGRIIACTQPRRVAAISVAQRVANEMDVQLGTHVGYSVRFDDRSGPNTRLKYLTDGMLMREAMTDPDFSAYSVIVLDEAHERTLSTDILMGVLKTVVARRNDLRLIVMSATMDTAKFVTFFGGAPLLSIPGRMFSVEIYYSDHPESNYVDAAVRTAVEVCEKEPPGDILVFLTGEDEIEEVCERVEEAARQNEHMHGRVVTYPLYGALPPDVQQRVFDPPPPPSYPGGPPGRKVICATNIAETSLTIDGVVYVIDTGLSKQKIYNPRARVESLLVDNISQASAKQRSGRAGRTQKGKCFRLYTRESFENDLLKTSYPEILRSNLGNVVLQMLKLGVKDLVHFDFMDPPAPETMMRALEMLNYLGAIDDDGQLTAFGDTMSGFPLEPEAAAALLRSVEHKCSAEVLTVVAMLSEAANCFLFPKKQKSGKRDHNGRNIQAASPRRPFEDSVSDHVTYINVYQAYQNEGGASGRGHQWCRRNSLNSRALRSAESVRNQLEALMRKAKLEIVSTAKADREYSSRIRQAILGGYFMQVAHRTTKRGMFKTAKDEEVVRMHPTSALQKDTAWVMYGEYVLTERSNFIRTCSEVDPIWLVSMAPHYFDLSNFPDGLMKDALHRAYRSQRKAEKKICEE